MSTGQAGDGIEQDDHMTTGFDHPLRPFDGEIGHPEVIGEIFVVGRGR